MKEGGEETAEVRNERTSIMRMRREQQEHEGWEKRRREGTGETVEGKGEDRVKKTGQKKT